MKRRRITPALGAAAGGLLSAALLPVAVAFADDYEIVPDPNSTETVTGLYGLTTISPAQHGSIQGYQLFDVVDTKTGQVVGTFDAYQATVPPTHIFGSGNSELLVTSDVSGTPGTAAGDVPPVGSVLNILTLSDSHSFENIYSALASTTPGGADTISDILVTASGKSDLSWLFGSFDAAKGLADHSPQTALPPYIVPASPPVFTAISGISPLDVAVQGYQSFNVVDANGAVLGTFDADETPTWDILGIHTQVLLVTSDVSGHVGTAAGDVPPVGSVLNTVVFGGGFEDIYSDLASTAPGRDVISDTLVTPLGNLNLSWLFRGFDAAKGLADHSPAQPFFFDHGHTIGPDPNSAETFTGVNGIPPMNASIQGFQSFDVFDAHDNVVGTFSADENTIPHMGLSNYHLALLVTSDLSGPVGTAAGDVPPVGSVFDIARYGFGFENIYSDLASTTPGGDVISDTLVTPFGHFDLSWLVQGDDLAAGLTDVSYADDAWWAGIFSTF